jgi:hypothetical protein
MGVRAPIPIVLKSWWPTKDAIALAILTISALPRQRISSIV